MGVRAQDADGPWKMTLQPKVKAIVEPWNSLPGAAPAACYGSLDDYDDLDEAPWALRYGVDRDHNPIEFVTPRMAACVKLSRSELEAELALINAKLPKQDIITIALVNGCAAPPCCAALQPLAPPERANLRACTLALFAERMHSLSQAAHLASWRSAITCRTMQFLLALRRHSIHMAA